MRENSFTGSGFTFLGFEVGIATDKDLVLDEFKKHLHKQCEAQHPPRQTFEEMLGPEVMAKVNAFRGSK